MPRRRFFADILTGTTGVRQLARKSDQVTGADIDSEIRNPSLAETGLWEVKDRILGGLSNTRKLSCGLGAARADLNANAEIVGAILNG